MKQFVKSLKNLGYLFSYFWKYGKVLFIISSLGLLYGPIQTYISIQSIKFTVDGITLGLPFLSILNRLVIYFAIWIVISLYTAIIDNYLWELLTLKITSGIKREVYEHVVNTDYKYFDDPKFYDDYSWTTDRLSGLTINAMHIIRTIISRIFTISTLVTMTISMDWVLIIFVIFSLIIGLTLSRISNKINFNKTEESQETNRSQSYIHRLFYMKDYADEIRTTKLSKLFLKRFDHNVNDLKEIVKKHRLKLTAVGIIDSSQEILFTAVCMIYLTYAVLFKGLTLGSFSAMITASAQLKSNLNQFFGIVNEIQNASLYTDRIKSFFNTKSTIENKKDHGIAPQSGAFSCEIKDLCFMYNDSEKYVLKNISLTIRKNEKIAIVGENGAGKTTLIKLLLRLYEPETGSININGRPIAEYSLSRLRENIGVVFQSSKVYATTIRENLQLFDTEIEDAEIMSALRSVGMDAFLDNNGATLDSQMTREFDSGGLVLSGGQTQLFNIARIFAKNYGLLILDEPSSALDPRKEYELNKIIMSEIKNSTVVIISHRLSTIRDADCIYVMDNGTIAEKGNHSELMQLRGKYFEMFNMQAENYIK